MKSTLLFFSLSFLLLSCSESVNNDAASERSGHSSEVPADQGSQEAREDKGTEAPTYESSENSAANGTTNEANGSAEQQTNRSKGSENNEHYSAYDSPTSGRDSLKTSTGVAGQQGGGAGVGNGGSLNAAQSK